MQFRGEPESESEWTMKSDLNHCKELVKKFETLRGRSIQGEGEYNNVKSHEPELFSMRLYS